jgi:hypothetical protein
MSNYPPIPPPPPPPTVEPEPEDWKRQAKKREKIVAFVVLPVMLVVLIAAAAAGGTDDEPGTAAATETADERPSCDSLVGNGRKGTDKVLADLEQRCVDESGELVAVRTESFACTDGLSVLHANDFGNGLEGGTWSPVGSFTNNDLAIEGCTAEPPTTTTTVPPATTTTAPPEDPEVSNARRSAQSYLDLSGFSRQGLIDQLSSEYGDQYPVEVATAAVDSLDVDWNAEAVEAAKSYLELQGFSHAGLVEQLSSPYGDQFTPEEAEHGASVALGG